MLRHCEGTDPTLIRWVDEVYVPCACGLEFDDVSRAVIFPHWDFAAIKQLAADIMLWEAEVDLSYGSEERK